jgi:glutamate-1-semialdehyde aminotransferase
MAAGLVVLELLSAQAISRMNELGNRICSSIREIGDRTGLPLTATGYGSVGNIHVASAPPRNARQAAQGSSSDMLSIYWRLIDAGYIVAPRGQFSTSIATTDADVDGLLEAVETVCIDVLG